MKENSKSNRRLVSLKLRGKFALILINDRLNDECFLTYLLSLCIHLPLLIPVLIVSSDFSLLYNTKHNRQT